MVLPPCATSMPTVRTIKDLTFVHVKWDSLETGKSVKVINNNIKVSGMFHLQVAIPLMADLIFEI